MGDGDNLCNIYVGGWRDGLSDFFQEVFRTESSFALCEEAVLPVHTVLGLDLTR